MPARVVKLGSRWCILSILLNHSRLHLRLCVSESCTDFVGSGLMRQHNRGKVPREGIRCQAPRRLFAPVTGQSRMTKSRKTESQRTKGQMQKVKTAKSQNRRKSKPQKVKTAKSQKQKSIKSKDKTSNAKSQK